MGRVVARASGLALVLAVSLTVIVQAQAGKPYIEPRPTPLTVSPKVIQFRVQPVGTETCELITWTNTSDITVVVQGAGSSGEPFALGGTGSPTSTCAGHSSLTVGPGQTFTWGVGFRPTEAVRYSGYVCLSYHDVGFTTFYQFPCVKYWGEGS